MYLRNHPHVKSYKRFLATHGISTFHVEHGGKHPVLVVEHAGAVHRLTFPSTSRSASGILNGVARLRRKLGLVGGAR
jgi:hypothetical protein